MRKSKNRYFYHILVSPGAITLNVVSMEREFYAYKLSRWMCPSNYNRFWHTVLYDSVYLTCSKKLMGSQLSLPHEINKKLKYETKNKTMSVIGLVQSHYCKAVQ